MGGAGGARLRLAGAAAVVTLRPRIPAAATAAICCAALVATLPDLAWGVGGKVSAVRYPSGWAAAAAMINADPRPVAVLPVDSMRSFAWAGDAPVLDPLPRWVRAEVLTTGDLTVAGRTVPGEGDRAREVQQLLFSGADREALAEPAWAGWSSNLGVNQRLPVSAAGGLSGQRPRGVRVGGDTRGVAPRDRAGGAHWCGSAC